MSSTTIALSTELYQSLLIKLVTVLELTQKPDGIVTPQAKQALLQATNDYKNVLAQARELATNLPGGELVTEEQEEVIQMLEEIRDRKKDLLARFSQRPLVSVVKHTMDIKTEIDSTASTPTTD
ncbi:hypothetical protein JOM56_005697 [Amanita muscaria]|uniref:Mediator of RNA polymerase II transcription subunit 9 n=1 Tax=Amanita muscaria (strain Koide BX008) TaxID=946122 RepID=A0A0C2WJR3_AMAMK|nr:hypothetical protein M378DRAFT_129492 [Amanita muscaria Koide BX008]